MYDLTGHANPAAGRLATNGRAGPDSHVPVLEPIGAALTAAGLARRAEDARALAESLPALGVSAVAITIVDNAGIARVKAVPVTGLEHAVRWGVGMSPAYGVATVDESFTASTTVGGPAGDLRLMPDPSALRIVGAQPGWAWVPADQYTQDGQVFACCQRSFARRMTELAGLRLPAEITGDPAGSHAAGRLPESLDQALAALRRSEVIPAAMGPVLYDAFTAVRAAEAETFGGQDPATITAAHRWPY